MKTSIISPITGNELILDRNIKEEYAVDTICLSTANTLNYTPVYRYANAEEEIFIPIN